MKCLSLFTYLFTKFNHLLHCFSFPDDPSEIWKMLLDQIARREARRAGSKRKGQRVLENVYFKSDLFFTIVKIQLIDDFERGHLSARTPLFEVLKLTGFSWHSREEESPRLVFQFILIVCKVLNKNHHYDQHDVA